MSAGEIRKSKLKRRIEAMNYTKPQILDSKEAMSSIHGSEKPPEANPDSVTHAIDATPGAYEADE